MKNSERAAEIISHDRKYCQAESLKIAAQVVEALENGAREVRAKIAAMADGASLAARLTGSLDDPARWATHYLDELRLIARDLERLDYAERMIERATKGETL